MINSRGPAGKNAPALVKSKAPRRRWRHAAFAALGASGLLATAAAQGAIAFQDVTDSVGLSAFSESWGAAARDINGDGWTDLYVGGHRLRPYLYRNEGGVFTDITLQADKTGTWIIKPKADLHAGTWGDFNDDGYPDLMVATGNCCDGQLFINGGGYLTEHATDLGVAADGGGRGDFWIDLGKDNDLDVVMAAFGRANLMEQFAPGGFLNRNSATGFSCRARTNHVQIADFSTDGKADLLCVREGGIDKLYDITPYASGAPFTDITANMDPVALVTDTAVGDFDGNLQSDLFALRGGLRPNEAASLTPGWIEALLDIAKAHSPPLGFTFQGGNQVTFNIDSKQFGPFRIYLGANGVHPSAVPFTLDRTDANVQGLFPRDPNAVDQALHIGFDAQSATWMVEMYANSSNSVRAYFQLQLVAGAAFSNVVTTGTGPGDGPLAPELLMNQNGVLHDEAATRGLSQAISCSSAAAGDFDNDGNLDLYAVCRGGVQNLPNRLYRNQGDGTFVEVAGAGGAAGPVGSAVGDAVGTGDSVVVADFNGDGRLDLFVTNGLNLQPGRIGGPNRFYRNVTVNNNHWIELDLAATQTNRDALGAKVYVTSGGVTRLREQGGGYHRWSQDDSRLHFGLGPQVGSNGVDLVRVEWPSGNVNEFSAVPADGVYRVTEGAGGLSSGFIASELLGPVAAEIGPQPGDECGEPAFDYDFGPALLLWRDCPGGLWHLRARGGRTATLATYQGSVTSASPFSQVTPVGLDFNDSLDTGTSGAAIYSLTVKYSNNDGFDFTPQSQSSVCFALNTPVDTPVLVGAGRWAATGAFDLTSFNTCTPPAPPAACGQPTFDRSTDAGVFAWRDCSTQDPLWHVRVTAGGSASALTYQGLVSSSAALTTTPFSIEGNDLLDTSVSGQVQYGLAVSGSGQDGFDLQFAAAGTACFGLDLPAGQKVTVGADGVQVAPPFDMSDLGSCQ